jgi:formylglycine-generating enzyme required for sulfatase activity
MFNRKFFGGNSIVSNYKQKTLRIFALVSAISWLTPAQPVIAQAPPSLIIQWTNGQAFLSVSGAASNACTFQFATNLTALNAWHFLTNSQATNDIASSSDPGHSSAGLCLYRVFTQTLPTNVVATANMIWISPGTFSMGSPTNEALRNPDETQHTVTLSHGFYMGKYLVTQGDYLALTGNNPSFFSTAFGFPQKLNRPVDGVDWSNVTNYCALLTQQEQLSGRLPTNWVYRLPTEAEWEYACRSGTTTAFYFGNQLRSGMANFDGRSEYDSVLGTITNSAGVFLSQTTVVGNYEPNAWGLTDMCGNIFEWCQDWYGAYPTGPITDPQGAATGTDHVLRGGGWEVPGYYARSAIRVPFAATTYDVGFRVVLAPNP